MTIPTFNPPHYHFGASPIVAHPRGNNDQTVSLSELSRSEPTAPPPAPADLAHSPCPPTGHHRRSAPPAQVTVEQAGRPPRSLTGPRYLESFYKCVRVRHPRASLRQACAVEPGRRRLGLRVVVPHNPVRDCCLLGLFLRSHAARCGGPSTQEISR